MTDPTDPTAVPVDQLSGVITEVAAELKSSLENLQGDIQGLLDSATGGAGTPEVPGGETPATVTVDVSALIAVRDQFAALSDVVDGLPTEGEVTPTPPIEIPTDPAPVDPAPTEPAPEVPLDEDPNIAQPGPEVPAPEGDTGGQIAGEGSTPV